MKYHVCGTTKTAKVVQRRCFLMPLLVRRDSVQCARWGPVQAVFCRTCRLCPIPSTYIGGDQFVSLQLMQILSSSAPQIQVAEMFERRKLPPDATFRALCSEIVSSKITSFIGLTSLNPHPARLCTVFFDLLSSIQCFRRLRRV